MPNRKRQYFCFTVVALLFAMPLLAQDEFHNLPVKVGKFQPVDIKFDDEIVNAILPCKGTFELERSSNGKAYTIISQKDEAGSNCFLTLVVGEGRKQRKHSFEIIFQEVIPEDEMVYDFTDSKNLRAAIKENDKAQKEAAKNKGKNTAKTNTNTKPPVAEVKPNVPKPEPTKEVATTTTNPPDANTGNSTSSDAGQLRKDNYYKAIGNAELALNSKDYEKAEMYYNQAKEYEEPGGTYVQSRLAEINKHKAEIVAAQKLANAEAEKERNYKAAITAGDVSFKNAELNSAQEHYRQALRYKEQDSYANSKIIEIDALIARQKREQEQAAVMAKYNEARASGDEYYKKAVYDMARGAYTEALRYNPGDSYVNNQLKNIQTNISLKQEAEAQKEKQWNYDENILMADAAFKTGDYETAITKYSTASKWKPSESYPASKLNEIKKLQKESALKAEQERVALEKQKKLDNDYAALVKKADELMNQRNLPGASGQYQKALDLKPYEDYPKQKLADIQNIQEALALAEKMRKDSLAAVAAKKASYNEAIAKGKKALNAKDYPAAKAAYLEAQQLFENESLPAEQISAIDKILADLAAREKKQQDSLNRVIAFNRAYDSILVVGANAMLAEKYDDAIVAFRKASDMKPDDVYARNLMRYVVDRKKDKEVRVAASSTMERRDAYRAKYNLVEPAIKDKRYLDAQVLIAQAKELMDPGEDYGRADEYFANRLSTIDYQLSLAKANGTEIKPLSPELTATSEPAKTGFTPVNTASAEIKEPVVASKRPDIEIINKNTIKTGAATASTPVVRKDELPVQQAALPYSREELWKRFPGVNFMEPPPGQGYNYPELKDSLENARLSNLVLQETDNRVNISDTQNGIVLTCEGISFSGTNAFYRLKLQNKTSNPFSTGTMNLIWQMKDQSEYRLYPGYITSFPLLLPQKEIIIVFVAKSAYLANDDQLLFTLRDRSKTTRLSLQIPGSVYNRESNR